jgi:hypothetical protein
MPDISPTDPPPLDRRKTDAGEGGAWFTIEEAAARLGLSKIAIRSKVKRGTLRSRPGAKENDGLTRVWVDPAATPVAVLDRPKTDLDQRPMAVSSSDLEAERMAHAATRARLDAAEAELARRLRVKQERGYRRDLTG